MNITVSPSNPSFTAQGNILYNKAKTKIIATGKVASNITVPNTVTEIAPYSFDGNNNLATLKIENTPMIGMYAYANCENLRSVYFNSYTVPTMGANAFMNNNFTLFVPHSKQLAYYNVFLGYTNSIDSIGVDITFVSDGENAGTKNTYYGATISSLIVPFKLGHDFSGWYDNPSFSGAVYANGGLWDTTEDMTLYAKFSPKKYYIIFDGTGIENFGDKEVFYGLPIGSLPTIDLEGKTFAGWKNSRNEYYTKDTIWKDLNNVTLTSDVFSASYIVTLDKQGGTGGSSRVDPIYLDAMPSATTPTRDGYTFQGYFTEPNGKGTKYYNANMSSASNWDIAGDRELYAYWVKISEEYRCPVVISNADEGDKYFYTDTMTHGENITIKAPLIDGYTFSKMWVNGYETTNNSYTINNVQLKRNLGYCIDGYEDSLPFYLWYPRYGSPPTNQGGLFMVYTKNECVAEGTLITLADGSQKAVETLTGNEMLLVWDLRSGTFSSAPILFIDTDAATNYEIIHAYFSDGTSVKIIGEHAFFDFNLNEYVFFRRDASQYLGHWFNKQTTSSSGQMAWERVQLVDVQIYKEYTTAWSPVTQGYLCYYVNGMLSMPGATGGLINIFEVNGNIMKYDEDLLELDIATYGLFTYEEFSEIFNIPEFIFEAFNVQYLKISIGKGLITIEELGCLIERYSEFF